MLKLILYSSAYCMELQPQTQFPTGEAQKNNDQVTNLNPELIKYIRTGDIVELQQVFSDKKTVLYKSCSVDKAHSNVLLAALEFTEKEIESCCKPIPTYKKCFQRYKSVILPTTLVGYSIVNITLSVLSYSQITNPNSIDIASLSLNVVGSALPGILFSGYEAIKYLRGGIQDRQTKEQIKTLRASRIFLQALHTMNKQ